MNEIKPCTCGSHKIIISRLTRLDPIYRIKCNECEKLTEWFDTKEKALERWNEMNKGQIE